MNSDESAREQLIDQPRGRRTLKDPRARGERISCGICGQAHETGRCVNAGFLEEPAANRAPLETPSSNGVYAGDPAKVRVLPSSVFGADLDAANPGQPSSPHVGAAGRSRERGRLAQKRERAIRHSLDARRVANVQRHLEAERRRVAEEQLEAGEAQEEAMEEQAEARPKAGKPRGPKRRVTGHAVRRRAEDRRCGRCGGTGHNARTCGRGGGTKAARTDGRTDGRTPSAGGHPDDAKEVMPHARRRQSRALRNDASGAAHPKKHAAREIRVAGAAVIRIRVNERRDGVDLEVSVEGE